MEAIEARPTEVIEGELVVGGSSANAALAVAEQAEGQVHPVALYLLSLGRHAANPARVRRVALSALDRAMLMLADRADEKRQPAKSRGQTFDWSKLTLGRMPALVSHLQRRHPLVYSFDWYGLAPAHLETLAALLADRYSPSYAAAIMAHVRGVARAHWRQGGIERGRLDRLQAVEVPSGEPERTGRALSALEIGLLLQASHGDRKSARGARDAAALALLYGAGLRRAEAVSIDVGQLDLGAGRLRRVKRKRGKVRDVLMLDGAPELLDAWLATRGDAPGPALTAVGQAGDVRGGGITTAALAAILSRLAGAAGVDTFTAHDLRRTGATRLYDATKDIELVRQWLGHASVQTTQRYLKLGERRLDAVRAVPML